MSNQQVGLLFDMVLCAGCYNCVRACMEKQGFEGEADKVTDLSATAYTSLSVDGDYPIRNLCRHCLKPSCASVCPVGALRKDATGPVVYDASLCMGCRYCIMACPFNVPRYEWHKAIPAVRKCDMCIDRQREGKPTACAEACPEEATVFGPRDELIALAHKRIKDDPGEYYDHVYGEHEIGGTSVLFLAPYPVEQLGYGKLGTAPLPSLTWNVLSKIPGLSIGVAASLVAFWWIMNRRDEVALAEGRKESDDDH